MTGRFESHGSLTAEQWAERAQFTRDNPDAPYRTMEWTTSAVEFFRLLAKSADDRVRLAPMSEAVAINNGWNLVRSDDVEDAAEALGIEQES